VTERPFRGRTRGVEVHLDAGERELLRHLLAQLDDLLDDGRPASTDPLAALVGFDLSAADLEDQPGADGNAVVDGEPDGELDGEPDEDPALARLLPEGNRDDPVAAAEFRRYTEGGLRARKRANARTASAALAGAGPVMLGAEEAMALLTSLTDVRLVLAERLGLRSDEDAAELHRLLTLRAVSPEAGDGQDRWAAIAAIYDILTWWQESLVAALSSRPYRRGHR
jgi:Domain of unknown function (DUF2017)